LRLSRVDIKGIDLKSAMAAQCRELLFRFSREKFTQLAALTHNSAHTQAVRDYVNETALHILSLGFTLFFPSPLEQVCCVCLFVCVCVCVCVNMCVRVLCVCALMQNLFDKCIAS